MERVGGGLYGSPTRKRKTPGETGVWKPAQQGAGSWVKNPWLIPGETAPTYASAGAPPGAPASPYGDPAYELAKAFATRTRSEAQARALEKRKSAAIQFGSAEGLQGLLGHDFGTVSKQASDNPYSVLKNLQWGYEHGVADLEEKLNKANLFYSGYRGEQLGDAAHQFQQSNYNARTQFQGLLSDVADQLAAALMQADYNEMLAAMNAQASSFPGPAAPPGPPVAAPPAPPATPPWVTQAAAAFNPTTTYALRTPPQFRPNPYMPGAY